MGDVSDAVLNGEDDELDEALDDETLDDFDEEDSDIEDEDEDEDDLDELSDEPLRCPDCGVIIDDDGLCDCEDE